MEHGKHVVEEVLYAHAETVEVALRIARQVWNALSIVAVSSKVDVTEPSGKPIT